MTDPKEHLKDLSDIRSMMEQSSRFMSLSGLSGVIAGICALAGAYIAYVNKVLSPNNYEGFTYEELVSFIIADASAVLFVSLLAGYILARRNSKKKGLPAWDKTAQRMLINMAIPLITGGIVCLILLYKYEQVAALAPITLVFYGLALVNASKYTLNDIRFLGILEIIVGIIALLYPANGLLFWAIGFGVLHIIYGAVMYFKYER